MKILLFALVFSLVFSIGCTGATTVTQTVTETQTEKTTRLDESIVQVWQSGELATTGVVVGDGKQVLTVLNYEVDTPESMDLSVVVPGREYDAQVQAIDSRTGATLLRIEGANLSKANVGDIQALLPGQELLVRGWRSPSTGDEPEFGETPVLYGDEQDDFPVIFFHVGFLPDAIAEGRFSAIGQGAVVTDESGNVLGLVGINYHEVFPHSTPIGYIPAVAGIETALELLSPNASQKPWANGPLLFSLDSRGVTWTHSGPLPEYDNMTTSLQELFGKMGEPLPSAELPADFYEILREPLPAAEGILTVVYASPVDLRDIGGTVVARAKWVGIMYNVQSKPFTLLYGSGRLVVEGGYILLANLNDLHFIPRMN